MSLKPKIKKKLKMKPVITFAELLDGKLGYIYRSSGYEEAMRCMRMVSPKRTELIRVKITLI